MSQYVCEDKKGEWLQNCKQEVLEHHSPAMAKNRNVEVQNGMH